MRKAISLFLVFSVLSLSVNMFAKERKGADLIILRTDGTQIKGELIAVKENSLLLLGRESGADVAIELQDITVIIIVKKKTWKNAKKGMLITGGISVVSLGIGALTWGLDTSTESILQLTSGVLIWIGIGALIGVLTGSHEGIDETIQIGGKSNSEIQEILEKFRKNARIKNAQ
jgi:hypothetical protein